MDRVNNKTHVKIILQVEHCYKGTRRQSTLFSYFFAPLCYSLTYLSQINRSTLHFIQLFYQFHSFLLQGIDTGPNLLLYDKIKKQLLNIFIDFLRFQWVQIKNSLNLN